RGKSCRESFGGGDFHGGEILQPGSSRSSAPPDPGDSAGGNVGGADADEIRRRGGGESRQNYDDLDRRRRAEQRGFGPDYGHRWPRPHAREQCEDGTRRNTGGRGRRE